MSRKLVIVESPNKIKSISNYLGADYDVQASIGHIRDLPQPSELPANMKKGPFGKFAVDVEGNFTPYYVVNPDKKKVVAELKRHLKEADELYLATDDDREGEAIAWHLKEVLKPKVPVRRMTFTEITREAITRALDNTREIDIHRVDAQETRRILDRLVGYEISPVLWRKIDLAKRRAALKAEADTEKAKADAAYTIQTQIQRRDIERETAQADIVKQEQEALVKEREVKVTRNALEATVNAQADADRYAAEQAANAKLYSRQREAEAEAFEQIKRAEATKQAMLAEADGLRAKGEAEAAAKAAILTAEAEGLEKKAEAMAKMNQAAVLEMYFKALPDVAAAIASPLANVDSITMYGEGNSAKMVADITNSLSQVNAGLGETMGLDLRQMLGALVGAKVVAPTVEQAVADGVDKGLNS